MRWQEIREKHPTSWLLVEAIQAHTKGDKRVLEQLAVIDTFDDGQKAMQAYGQLHAKDPQRELLVLHTSREELDVTVRRWLGIRGVST